MKHFLIFLLVSIGIIAVLPVYAQCLENEDWSNAPCYDMGPVTKEQFKDDWAPYYYFKGPAWMENKKQELYDVMEKYTFKEWVKDPANANVYTYYVSTGDVPKQSGGHVPMFKHETLSYKLGILILSLPLVGAAILGYFIIRRRRKK